MSGTTGLACKNLQRNFIGVELEKEYFQIAKERLNLF
nr:DNA methyltransferase [Helicobacter pylori]